MSFPPPPTPSVVSMTDLMQPDQDEESIGASESKIAISITKTKSNQTSEENSFINKVFNFFNFLTRLFNFRFTIQQRPIYFYRPTDHTASGTKDTSGDFEEDEMDPEVLEVKVNFRDELFERYREVIEERLEAKAMKDSRRIDEINLEQFPGWNKSIVIRLKSLFLIFDHGGDGLVDFSEFSDALNEYGDQTSENERRYYFNMADVESIGSIDLEEFLTMMYNLTMKAIVGTGGTEGHRVLFNVTTESSNSAKRKEAGLINPSLIDSDGGNDELTLSTLGNSLRRIDRNMSRIKSLDVVQQLQAGLF